MCGIVGLISNGTSTEMRGKKGFIKQGLLVDSLRGEHSTGLFSVNGKDNKVSMFKAAMAGWDFVSHSKTDDIISSIGTASLVVGHNRHATQGAINAVNAHPFEHGNIIGVHNGSLKQHKTLLEDGKFFDVDSDAVFHSIDKVGVQETVKKMHGAYAIVYYDKKENTVNFFRNEERPFYLARVKHANKDITILYASEAGMIDWLAFRNNLEIEKISLLKTHTLVTYKLDNLEEYTTTKLDQYVPPVYDYGRRHTTYPKQQKQLTDKTVQLKAKREEKSKKVLDSVKLKKGDNLVFCVTGCDLYNKSDGLGYIEGWTNTDPWCEVVVHGVDKDFINGLDNYQNLGGKVFSGTSIGDDDVLVQVDKNTLQKVTYTASGDFIFEGEVDRVKKEVVAEKQEGTEEKKSKPFISKGLLQVSTGYQSREDLKTIANRPCVCCKTNISPMDSLKVGWTNERQPICPGCLEDLAGMECLGEA